MKVYISGRREGYSPEQCRESMTVRELIEYLEQFDDGAKVYLRNDNGYTYGSITESSFTDSKELGEEDEEYEE